MNAYPIIGMSPGNSYFKDAEVEHLLRETVGKYGQAAVFVADIPAIATYLAYGYPENKARAKAVLKGNNLKNRSRRIAEQLGIADRVRVIEWEEEVESSLQYQEIYARVRSLYQANPEFAAAVDSTTSSVLEHSGRELPDVEAATKVAVHYLLSEIAFMEFAPVFLGTEQALYVYHRNWPVYERYVAGRYDGAPKPHLEFLLLEHPTETYRQLGEEQMERISQEGVLRCAYSFYAPGIIENEENGDLLGVFHDLLARFAEEQGWNVEWVEEVGYGVIQEGLREGRFDIFAAPVWPTPEREPEAAFSSPVYFSDVGMWVREADLEPAKEASFASDASVRVAIRQGDITESIADADFPAWRRVRVPQLTDMDDLLRFVAEEDADVTFAERCVVESFNASSPAKLANAAPSPVRRFANCFMLGRENGRLLSLLEAFIAQAKERGDVASLLKAYVPDHEEQGISEA